MLMSLGLALISAAATATDEDDAQYESAGKLPSFTFHGADLEEPGMLERVVAQVCRHCVHTPCVLFFACVVLRARRASTISEP